MKKKLFVLAALVSIAAIITIGSLAYFTGEDKATNVITTGGIDIELEEWMVNPDPDGDELIPYPNEAITGVMPATGVSKIVQITNTGPNAAYVRMKVVKTLEPSDPESTATLNPDLVKLDFDQGAWTLSGGFYYYNLVLNPGETTTPLFTNVTFDADMDNDYQGMTVSVDVVAHAVQEANNGSNALEATGWPAA